MAIVANPVIENFNKDFAVLGLPYVYIVLNIRRKCLQVIY